MTEPGFIAINPLQSIRADAVFTADNMTMEASSNVATGAFGDGVVHQGAARLPSCRMAWTSPSSGTFDLWALYASAEPRGMSVLVDGQAVSSGALSEVTGGWQREQAMWRYQSRVTIPRQGSVLALECHGPCPHVLKVVLARAEPGSQPEIAPIDSPLARCPARSAEAIARSTQMRPQPLDLVRALMPAIRHAFDRGVSEHELGKLVSSIYGALTLDAADPQARVGFAGPLNGQRIRQRLFALLNHVLHFDALIETGAYLGTTTEFFALRGIPVYSCEAVDEHFYFAAMRLCERPNVKLFLEDSRQFLNRYVRDYAAGHVMPFFYLDAHWQDDLPLPEEIDIIADSQEAFVIMIDDFKSPFDAGYGYDRYPSGAELTLEYVQPRLRTRRPLAFAFPSMGAEAETGARRGTLLVFPERLFQDCFARSRELSRAL